MGMDIYQVSLFASPVIHKLPIIREDIGQLGLPTQG